MSYLIEENKEKNTAYRIRLSNLPYIQDVNFCLPNATDCYTAASKGPFDCVVSCSGLYADVVFNEDRILNLRTELGRSQSPSIHYNSPTIPVTDDRSETQIRYNGADNQENRQKLLELLEKYEDYKRNYARQIIFNPEREDLSKCFGQYMIK